jgi:hypothetical protein
VAKLPQGRVAPVGPRAAAELAESQAIRRLLPSTNEKAALRGTSGVPTDSNRYVTDVDVRLLPPKAFVPTLLSSTDIADRTKFDATGLGVGEYAGWAICNGNNGTPNLSGLFPRFVTSGAGGTGGSDTVAHTHAINHDHAAFTSGSESTHAHDAFNMSAHIAVDSGDTPTLLYLDASGVTEEWTETNVLDIVGTSSTEGGKTTGVVVTGGTGSGSAHSHSVDVPAFVGVSGTASNTENRPAYYEVVPLTLV